MAPIPFNPFKKPPLHTPTTTPIKATPKNVTPKNVVDIRPSLADIREVCIPSYHKAFSDSSNSSLGMGYHWNIRVGARIGRLTIALYCSGTTMR